MTPIYYQDHPLKNLLSQFVQLVYITEAELQYMQLYLFDPREMEAPVTRQSDLYDTLVYLRDLAQVSGFTTLQELNHYFEQQETGLEELIQSIQPEHKESPVFSLYRPIDILYKTGTIIQMTRERSLPVVYSDMPADRLWPIIKSKDWRSQQKSSSTNITFAGKLHRVIASIRNWWNPSLLQHRNNTFREINELYKRVYKWVTIEKPIAHDSFKMLVTRLMLMSKLRNPVFAKYLKSVQQDRYPGVPLTGFLDAKQLYYRHLSNKKWTILRSPDGKYWDLPEDPGVWIHLSPFLMGQQHLAADTDWTTFSQDALIYFPVSKEYCLRLSPLPDRSQSISLLEDEVIGHINNSVQFQICNLQEFQAINYLVNSLEHTKISSGTEQINRVA